MDRVIGGGPTRHAKSAGARVLLVASDPDLVRLVETELQARGFAVSATAGGEEGAERAGALHTDVILLDCDLPDPGAEAFLRSLRAVDETGRVPVLLLAARCKETEGVKALGEMADDYLGKPFGVPELGIRISALLQRHERHMLLTEAEKLKTLREVIASVCHGVNNPLAAILMSAESLALRHPGVAGVVEKSRVIEDNVLRIREVLRRLEGARVTASQPYAAGERILDLSGEEAQR